MIVAVTIALLATLTPGVPALAIGSPPGGLIIPMGSTASFTNVQFGACNSLTWGYKLNASPNQNHFKFGGASGTGTGPNMTIGPFPPPPTLPVSTPANPSPSPYTS